MTQTRDIIHLAALLHDIGKFYQRADVSYYNSDHLAKIPHVVKNADYICPTSQEGYFKYQHVIWTQLFFEENLDLFQKLGVYDKNSTDNLVNVSIHHHKPSSKLQAFIQYADWWASGIDRSTSEINDDEEKIKRGKLKFKEEPLISIFGNLKVEEKENSSPRNAFSLDKLSLKDNFPSNEKYVGGVSKEQYAKLWLEFSAEFKQIPTDSLSVFNTSLHYLLKKYCWCIPASTIDFADNSLFDHLKITAAIAQSLFDYQTEKPDAFTYDKKLSLQKGHLPLLLLCVDTSGIQKFIYDISSKFASKSLKGRSFSLQLMLDEIANEIIKQTETTLSHIIYSSGGKFFMLLPNTDKVKDILSSIENDIKKAIWEKYKGNIYVCIGYEPFAYDLTKKVVITQKESGSLGSLWRKVSENTAEKKYQKFKDLLIEDFENFFNKDGIGLGGLTDICSVTGEEVSGKKIKKIDDEIKVSPQILEQKEIGQALAKNDFIVLGDIKQHNLEDVKKFHSLIGRDYQLLTKNDLLPTENAEVCLTVKDEINFLKPVSAKNTAYSYRFYGGSEMALDANNTPKNFEQLAGIERENSEKDDSPIDKSKSTGNYNRIAILRMDVDGLGQLFIKGFKPENASFSAYATLSGQLDWFFSGYLNTIRRKPEYKDWVNIIYSGGDDVFAVGRWDSIIHFAEEVQTEFKRFTGRTDITISAGISIVTPKFPIAKGAELAGDAEAAAKGFKRIDETEKNAVCLFETPLGWEEFEIVKKIKDFWLGHLDGERPILSKGILQKMFDWFEISKQKDKNNNPDLSWKWNAAYSLKRHETKDNYSKNNALKTIELMLLCNQFKHEDKSYSVRFEVFMVACRWAELELKDKKVKI